jgi:Dolichyl-phosphate-mannose-protein mannosyltransferase
MVRSLFGDSLLAIRILPALAGTLTVFLVGILARELGGGRYAQILAAIGATLSPIFLGICGFYSMNALDLLLWAVAAWLLLRALASERNPRNWILLGVILGLGLLNKISALWLCGGIFLGLLLTSYRRVLLQPWPWIAVTLAGLLFLPHALWQIREGWPTLEFMRNAAGEKMAEAPALRFLSDQILSMNPGSAPIWLAGIAYGLFAREARRARVLSVIYIAVLALLLAAGRSRASYLSVAYPMLLASGGVALGRTTSAAGRHWLRPCFALLVILAGAPLIPLALPVLPVEQFVRYQSVLKVGPSNEERHEMGPLPQHYADMFGWEEMTDLVARAFGRLSPEERRRCRVFGQNYGEAGAIDVLGRKRGLPRALSGHNSYWLWGRDNPDTSWSVLIIIGGDREGNARFFEEIEIVGRTDSPWAMPYERGLDISIARRPKLTKEQAWPMVRRYI